MVLLAFGLLVSGSSCGQKNKPGETMTVDNSKINNANLATATFGSGCFWCTEAIFQNVDGVVGVASGYMGGSVANPTYEQVCSGLTGHAEVIQLTYDPAEVSYEELLEIFWQTHNPTTLNRQGADVGSQYRSVVFYHTAGQKKLAEFYKTKLQESNVYADPIVTELAEASEFYKAEDYHQNYYNLNSEAPYCTFVIQPKLEKFRKVFKEKLKN